MTFKQYILKEAMDYTVSDKIHTSNKIHTFFKYKFLFKGKKYYVFFKFFVNIEYKIINNKYEGVIYNDPAPNIEIINVDIHDTFCDSIKELDDKGHERLHVCYGDEHYSYFTTYFIPGMFIKFVKNKSFFVTDLDKGVSHNVGQIGEYLVDLSSKIYTYNHS